MNEKRTDYNFTGIPKKKLDKIKESKPFTLESLDIPDIAPNRDIQQGFISQEKRKRFQIGDGYYVVKMDFKSGLYIGDTIFGSAPWRVNIAGGQSGAIISFTADDATPAVSFANIWATSTTNSVALNITDFLQGSIGQKLTILGANNTNKTTIKDAGNLHLTADWVENTDKTLVLIYNGSAWIELSRT